jgi:hypothetical protein
MLAGIPVKAVVKLRPAEGGLGVYDTTALLEQLGVHWNILAFPRLMWNCWHLVTIPSLNIEGGLHAVLLGLDVYDTGLVVLDPQEGREGKKIYTEDNLRVWSDPIIVTGVG